MKRVISILAVMCLLCAGLAGAQDYGALESCYLDNEDAILSTSCKRLLVKNNGQLADGLANAALDYIDDCDTFNTQTDPTHYLYDGGPIVGRIEGTDTLLFRTYQNDLTADNGFRPVTWLEVDSTGNADYSYATGECMTADSAVGLIFENYFPKSPDTCESIVQVLKFFNKTDATLYGVYLGGVYDWDVPSDSGARNGSGFDLSEDLIYQYGAEYDQDDSTEALCEQESSDRFAGVKLLEPSFFRNAKTFDNATYMDTLGPFGADAPLPAGYVYNHLTNNGLALYTSSDPDSQYVNLSMLVTYGMYHLDVGDTIVMVQLLFTGREGRDACIVELDKTKEWAYNHSILERLCCVVPGDANNDGVCNIGDTIFMITYAFRGGAAPVCPPAGDANGDCGLNVGDAVFILGYCFRGGAGPICGCAK